MKLVRDGISMMHTAAALAKGADWVAIASFNLNPNNALFTNLPVQSHVLIGLPETSRSAWEAGAWLKMKRPDLTVVGNSKSHAKYAMFKRSKTKWLMFGSANFTMSPLEECVLFMQDPPENLWDAVAKLHSRLIQRGHPIPAMNIRERMSSTALKALSSKSVTT